MENDVSVWSELEVSENQHWITAGFRGRGDLTFEGVLRFSGHWNGTIHGEGDDNHLIVLEGAVLTGKIVAASISIEGGDLRDVTIEAQEIHVCPKGRVKGRIQSGRVRIDEGAIIEGEIAMAPV